MMTGMNSPTLGVSALDSILDSMLRGLPLEDEVEVLGHSFRLTTINRERIEHISRACSAESGNDLITREYLFGKRVLAQSITEIDGEPVHDELAMERFVGKLPPTVIELMLAYLGRIRAAQSAKLGGVLELAKKDVASP